MSYFYKYVCVCIYFCYIFALHQKKKTFKLWDGRSGVEENIVNPVMVKNLHEVVFIFKNVVVIYLACYMSMNLNEIVFVK